MSQLVPSQLGQRLLEKAMVGIREEQFDRRARRLFFTMGMIEQHLVEMSLYTRKPFRRGFGRQVEHGAGV
jgi:hypothetical protein